MSWQSIESAPKKIAPMILVRGVFYPHGKRYVTDPYAVFWCDGRWERWPHAEPPTHWMEIPELTEQAEFDA